MILTPRQRKSLDEALALSGQQEQAITYLERIAEAFPDIRERVANLRTRKDYVQQVATIALEADRQMSE